jgi:hypothetical protein
MDRARTKSKASQVKGTAIVAEVALALVSGGIALPLHKISGKV